MRCVLVFYPYCSCFSPTAATPPSDPFENAGDGNNGYDTKNPHDHQSGHTTSFLASSISGSDPVFNPPNTFFGSISSPLVRPIRLVQPNQNKVSIY